MSFTRRLGSPDSFSHGRGLRGGFRDAAPSLAKRRNLSRWPEPEKGWREPEPIEAPLYPVPAFDEKALLPDGLRGNCTTGSY